MPELGPRRPVERECAHRGEEGCAGLFESLGLAQQDAQAARGRAV